MGRGQSIGSKYKGNGSRVSLWYSRCTLWWLQLEKICRNGWVIYTYSRYICSSWCGSQEVAYFGRWKLWHLTYMTMSSVTPIMRDRYHLPPLLVGQTRWRLGNSQSPVSWSRLPCGLFLNLSGSSHASLNSSRISRSRGARFGSWKGLCTGWECVS
jgi:hypothetical protein